jgi:hypothetical protein
MTDGDRRFWLHTAFLEASDGTSAPAFVVDERDYPDREAARAALREAFDALQLRGVAAEFEAVLVRPGEPAVPLPSWSEYQADGSGTDRRAAAGPASRSGVCLRVALGGELDRERLGGLQEALGMRRGGRLSDDAAEIFGLRVLGEDENAPTMRLHRGAARTWTVTVSSRGDQPSAQRVGRWREQIVAAATAAGLTVGEVWMRPELTESV